MPFAFFVIVITIVFLAARASIAAAAKADEAWTEAARRLKLKYSKNGKWGPRSLRGEVEGYRIKVSSYKRSSGNNSTTYTKYELLFSKENFEYQLTRAKALSGVAAFLGSQDIEIGSEEFDKGVIVKSSRPKHIRTYLTPDRQQAVMNILLSYSGSIVKNGEVEWEERGLAKSAAMIEGVLRRFVRLAKVMDGVASEAELAEEEAASKNVRSGPVLLADQEGPIYDLPPVFEPEPVVVHHVPDPPRAELDAWAEPHEEEPEVFEPEEASSAAGQRTAGTWGLPSDSEEASTPVEEAPIFQEPVETIRTPLEEPEPAPERELELERAPGADALDTLKTTAASLTESVLGASVALGSSAPLGSEPEAPEPEQAPESNTPSAGPSDLTAAEVCEELFADGALGTKVDKLFREHFAETVVTWEGELERLDSYFSDFNFEGGAGTKATVIVHEIEGAYGNKKAEAVLQLGPDAVNDMRDKIGSKVRFRGKLIKCESFMRRLFVSHAEIL